MKVALVHDWLVGWGGAERVLQELVALFPGAPVFTAVWAPDAKVRAVFGDGDVRPSPLQGAVARAPALARGYRGLLPLMPAAFRSFDLRGFDLVLSSSHAFSKAVRVPAGVPHVCYCHTPPRYLWDLYAEYAPGWRGLAGAPLAAWLRRQDRRAAAGVKRFVANSATVAERIARAYGVGAVVVPPPVDLAPFVAARRDVLPGPEAPFVAGGRMVGYKRLDVAIAAANLAALPLVVFGDGPERRRLERMAGPTVRFVGTIGDDALPGLLAGARAFVFPAEEDFGLLPVEAMAAGTPVLAFAKGGAAATVGAAAPFGGGRLVESREAGDWARAMQALPPRSVVPAAELEGYSVAAFQDGMRRCTSEFIQETP